MDEKFKKEITQLIKNWRDETRMRQQKMSESLDLLIRGVESINRMMERMNDDTTGEVQTDDSE